MVNLFVNASFNDEPLHQPVCGQHLKGMKDEKLRGEGTYKFATIRIAQLLT
jgi:hypothetical protein